MKVFLAKILPVCAAVVLTSCSGTPKNNAQAQVLENGTLANPETASKNSPEYQPFVSAG